MSKRLPIKSELPTMLVKSHQDQATSGKSEVGDFPLPAAPSVEELIQSIRGGSSVEAPSVEAPIPADTQIDNAQSEQALANEPNPVSDSDSTTNQAHTITEQISTAGKTAEHTTVEQASFLASYWPYLLIGFTIVGWVITQMLLKREPSYKPTVLKQPKKLEDVETNRLRGQFKKSERYVKPKDKSSESKLPQGTDKDSTPSKDGKPSSTKPSTTKEKVTNNLTAGATPTDDEFDLSNDGLDSDVFSSEEAAEITNAVDARKKSNSSKRFKTEDDIDGFEGDEDEVVSFDDEDSQLSRGFLGSNKLADAELADAPRGDAEKLADQKPEITGEDVTNASAAVSGSAAKGSFFSRVFGAKTKREGGLDDDDNFGVNLDNEIATSASENSVAKPVAKKVQTSQTKGTVDDSAEDSGEFEFGLFENKDTESLGVTKVKDCNNKPSVAEPRTAAAMAGNAGLAGMTLTKVAPTSETDAVGKIRSETHWQTKVSTLESENLKLSDQASTLEDGNLKLSDQISTLEDENLKLSNQVDELTQQITKATENATQADSLAQERNELTKTVESLEADKEALLSEKNQLAEEFKAANKRHAVLEKEKTDLLQQYEKLTAEKATAETSATELAALQTEAEAFADWISELESEIQSLKAELLEAQSELSRAITDEEIKELKERFKKRLTDELRKRTQAELLFSEAEKQRSEVAELLQSTNAEILALKAKYDHEDVDIGN